MSRKKRRIQELETQLAMKDRQLRVWKADHAKLERELASRVPAQEPDGEPADGRDPEHDHSYSGQQE